MANEKDKKLDFGKLNFRKKRKSTTPPPQKVYKEVEQLPKDLVKPEEPKPTARIELNAEVPTPKPVVVPAPVARKKKVKAKKKETRVGRKSWKDPEVNYTRLAFDTPIATKQKLKQLLATTFFGKFISQDEMINHAINDFIKKHKMK